MMTVIAPLLVTLLCAQDKFPAEDHAWLRFKTGASITNKVLVEVGGNEVESVQKLTLKERKGDEYVVEETTVEDGKEQPGKTTRTTLGTFTGEETLTIAGKEHPCRISTEKGKRDDGDTETRFWMPKGNKYPLKVTFKQADGSGEVVAVALDEKIKIGTREYSCVKLSGKVKFGEAEGTLTAWLSQEIPSAQARLELVLKTAQGDFKITITPTEFHDGK